MATPIPGLNAAWQAGAVMPPGSIAANTTNATRIGGLAAVIAAVTAAVAPMFQPSAQDPLAVQVADVAARAAVMVAALAVLAVLIAVDVSARSALAAAPDGAGGAGGTGGQSAVPTAVVPAPATPQASSIVPLPQALPVRITGQPGAAQALAVRLMPGGTSQYLIARPAAQLDWVPQTSIEVT